ncbi:dipeptidase PepE [bacterium]|nr:dipeptidase PepE [bacterium]
MRLLLLSNSTNFGESYLSWCASTIAEFLSSVNGTCLFIPYAAVDFSYDQYVDRVNQALEPHQTAVEGIHSFKDKVKAVKEAGAIIVGGGNTFHLLKMLQNENLIDPMVERVKEGTPYVGWSAGSNIACPTIRTTNDMPIVQPNDFNALGLIPFQINPHYTDKMIPDHGGESRMQRLMEFLAANPEDEVVCLPEASYLLKDGAGLIYKGEMQGRHFRSDDEQFLDDGQVLLKRSQI